MTPRRRILPVFIPHMGCPHACVFCNQHKITAAPGSTAPVEPLEELDRLLNLPLDGTDRELAFYGGSFTAIPLSQQLAFLEPAAKALADGRISSIRLSTRPDAVDSETLARLSAYGVSTVELGAQSMRDEVLVQSGRGHTAQNVRDASGLIKKAGIQLVLQMMTGLPGDDDDGARYTARELIALQPDAVRIYPTVVIRGTRLAQLWQAGEYREHSVEDAVRVCSGLLPLFEDAGIPVIRLGLNPTEELGTGKNFTEGAALAGAYHPALGELVRSRILRNRLEEQISVLDCFGKTVIVTVSPNLLSQTLGQRRCNVIWLKEHFHLKELRIQSGEVQQLKIEIL